MRPMRRAKREVTDSEELRAIVEGCRTVRLGASDDAGLFIVPLNFVPVTDPAGKLHGLERIMAHLAPDAPVTFSPEAVNRVAVWRVDVDHFTGKHRA